MSFQTLAYKEENKTNQQQSIRSKNLSSTSETNGVISEQVKCLVGLLPYQANHDSCTTSIVPEGLSLLEVYFIHDSFEVPNTFIDEIQVIARFMNNYKSTSIELFGYASMLGDREYNLYLSQKRAASVKDILTQNGVDPERVKIVGFGASQVNSTNSAEDRKVIVVLTSLTEELLEELVN
ncbi:OmpA family protein [Vibrio sp. Isolate32]|nr:MULTISPECIES: OmpA family protein [unclassified Vibrio]MCG9555590.1 OmpA family protein [Vibrio sp. Isolate32]